MKKLIGSALSALILLSSLASCMNPDISNTKITSSDDLSEYAEFLENRLGDSSPRSIILATEEDGYEMSDFQSDGYITRAIGGEVFICGKTEAGVDRGVRDFVNHGNSDNYEKTYNEGYRVKKITLAEADISEYKIVIPENANENVVFAAENIRDYTKKACGEVLDITTEESAHMIRFVPDKDGTLGDEGFTISTEKGQLTITYGKYRGALYGAMEFLEAYMGWRFLYNPYQYRTTGKAGVVDYLYENDSLVIPVGISDTQTPSMPYREPYDSHLYGSPEGAEDFAYKIKYNGEGTAYDKKFGYFGIQRKACHGLLNSVEVREYVGEDFTKHPCYSDEEFIGVVTDWVLDTARNSVASGAEVGAELSCIDISGFDSGEFCKCTDCLDKVRRDESVSGAILSMVNSVARSVDEEFPGLYVSMLAYYGCNKPPKKTLPEKNVHVSYCFYVNPGSAAYACGNHCYDGSDCDNGDYNAVVCEEFKKWCEITSVVSVWCYGEHYFGAVPSAEFDVLRQNIKFMADNGCYGIFYLVGSKNDGADFWSLMSYLAVKLMWNADMSEEEYYGLIREYCLIMYGEESGDLVFEYLGMMERARHMVSCYCQIRSGIFSRFNKDYYSRHYLYMNSLFEEALRAAPTSEAYELLERLRVHVDFMGIASAWEDMYLNGTNESRRFISERYRAHWEDCMRFDYAIAGESVKEYYPSEGMDFEMSPYDYMGRKEW